MAKLKKESGKLWHHPVCILERVTNTILRKTYLISLKTKLHIYDYTCTHTVFCAGHFWFVIH